MIDLWISTKLRFPPTGSLCLVFWADAVQGVSYRRVGLGFACEDGYVWESCHGESDSIPDHEVTYWQPLPEPPRQILCK